jgi:NAD-dependent protein deacetylase/lipoamidase
MSGRCSLELGGLAEAREWIVRARRVAALTGAGLSQESGVPVFRGPGGLWRNFRPEELATPEAFRRDPKLVWEWYDWRRSVIARAEPNRAHRALAELERAKPEFCLITQNVDGLEERAGSRRVIRLHGDIWRLRCTACGQEETNREVPLEPLPPRCRCDGPGLPSRASARDSQQQKPERGGLMRPGVVWFGEALPEEALEQAFRAARDAEVFLVVGTSAVVYPAAALPKVAWEQGARVIEVNPEATALSGLAQISLRGPAAELLPELIRGLSA